MEYIDSTSWKNENSLLHATKSAAVNQDAVLTAAPKTSKFNHEHAAARHMKVTHRPVLYLGSKKDPEARPNACPHYSMKAMQSYHANHHE
mmetsp:Transcript_29082/g.61879  ORF Transcript_29082/g.61879 Transcript_29082/m.61879 type:complete len:90 (-) Transcript_29082:5-274(-)